MICRHITTLPLAIAVLGVLALVQAGCGSDSPAAPTPTPGPPPTVTSIAPSSGSTLGGTVVTITGANFSSGAAVTIGGTAATNVSVGSPTSITATTPQRDAGVVDVVVSVSGRSGTLPGAYTYQSPSQPQNQLPVVRSITVQGSRPRQPANFADLGEEINVTATVTDAETAPSELGYEWSANAGSFTDSGRAVTWRAPTGVSTPLEVTLTLTVVEEYQALDDSGVPVDLEHRVTSTAVVRVHDSVREVGDMATLFLENFSMSSVPVDVVMQDFTPSCSGTADERADVEDNRREFIITSYSVGPPSVTVDFGGRCAFRNKPGDACSNSAVEWHSTRTDNGQTGIARGVDQVAAVYRQGRWWLCSSDFDGMSVSSTSGAPFRFLR